MANLRVLVWGAGMANLRVLVWGAGMANLRVLFSNIRKKVVD